MGVGGRGTPADTWGFTQHWGQHGLGLKETIAFFVRKNQQITIEAKKKTYSFSSVNNCLHCTESSSPVDNGTKITVEVANNVAAKKIVEDAKANFIKFSSLSTSKDLSLKGVTVHRYDHNDKNGKVFVNGGLVSGHVKVACHYNFVNITEEMRKCMASNHSFTGKKFSYLF